MPDVVHGEVTETRRRCILWVLWVHGVGTPASITALLKKHIEIGNVVWPRSPWKDGKHEPYECGTRQHLDAMTRPSDGRVIRASIPQGLRAYGWNSAVLTPRAHAANVARLRGRGLGNKQVAVNLGISPGLASAIYHDPFGFREKERKSKYCGGCGEPKTPEQEICPGCVRRRREQEADRAEALLPDREWAERLPVVVPVDFAVTEDLRRVLIVHTERGKLERQLVRGESWEHAVNDVGVLRA